MRELPDPCSEVLANLPLFVGRDLEGSELEFCEAHLEDCADCRAELESAEAARTALLSLRDEPLPKVDLWAGVRARLEADERSTELTPAAPRLRKLTGGRVAAFAAAACLLVVAGWQLFGGEPPRDEAPIAALPVVQPRPEPIDVTPDRTVPDLAREELAERVVAPAAGGLRPIGADEALRNDPSYRAFEEFQYEAPRVNRSISPNRAVGGGIWQ